MRKQLLMAGAVLLVGCGVASAQKPPAVNDSSSPPPAEGRVPDKPSAIIAVETSGAPVPETTGQAPKFEDRWSAQHGTPDRPPATTAPDANAPSPETTGQTSAKSEKMESEMDAVGEAKTGPGEEKQ
jgi:hypothetical protein